MCETYNGYANRETWAFCLWLDNDQGSHEQALDTAEQALKGSGDGGAIAPRIIGEALRIEWENIVADVLDDPSMRSKELLTMLFDVGSLYRIDWDEVGSHYIPAEHGR